MEKEMRPVLLATLLGSLVAATPVLAAGEFEGPWVGAGMGFRGTNTEISGTGFNFDGIGKTSVYGTVLGGYAWRTGDFTLGPYAQYMIGTVTSNTAQVGGINTNVKWKNQFQIGLQPGYFLTKESVVYLKAGYSHVTVELNGANAAGQFSNDQGFSGPGIGLGLKTQFESNWIIFVDAQQVYFKSKNFSAGGAGIDVKPKMTMATFGFGYQF
jgi:opacity protein-like surface antigen